MDDAHNTIDSRIVTVDRDYIYNDANYGARSTDGEEAVNHFDDVSYGENSIWVSRADWEGTLPLERSTTSREAKKETVDLLKDRSYEEDGQAEEITVSSGNLTLADMEGLEYDDPLWNDLLSQLSVEDMSKLIQLGGWSTPAISSIGKPYLMEVDGPAGVNDVMTGLNGNQFMTDNVLCATWNKELARKKGELMGAEAASLHVAGIYAPAANIHRSPFGGRNFEYFSEDGYLSGTMVSAQISGIQSQGIYCYLKHFALNDQETNRSDGGLCVWTTEQAMREIYLKPFEIAVKEADVQGIMTALNRIGAVNVSESSEMLQGVLENEWGFQGTVVTDSIMACDYINIDRALLAGTDLVLSMMRTDFLTENSLETATGNQAMRQACHDILYTEVNSSALDTVKQPTPYWLYIVIVADIAILLLFVRYYVRRHKRMKNWKESQVQIMKENSRE